MSVVALTSRQVMFFNYFKEYHQAHGFFPSPSQAMRDLRERGVKCSHMSVETMIGNLFLKGAFTGGKPMAWGNIRRKAAVGVSPININAQPTVQPRTVVQAPAARVAASTQEMAPAPASNALSSFDVEKLRKLLSLF